MTVDFDKSPPVDEY